jgi:hypothetical protein
MSHAPGGARSRALRWLVAAAAVGAVLLGLPAPAAASSSGPQLTLSVSQRWGLASTQGTWTPYVVTVRNVGSANFTGEIELVPHQDANDAYTSYPVYREPITVGRQSQRTVTMYVIDSSGGYAAEILDAAGRVLASAQVAPGSRGTSALGVLSDLPQAAQRIEAPLQSLTRVDASFARFSSPQAFPTNALYLSGLSGVIVDDFDSAALSQAQLRALQDFVGLGGSLIEVGGPSWRRTLLPLPSQLLPMLPSGTAVASLGPLADLADQTSNATTQVVTGPLEGSARAALVSPEGLPLVVERAYGAGDVVELAFDPFSPPFDSQVTLAAIGWSQAIERALSGVEGPSRTSLSGAFGIISAFGNSSTAAAPGSWAPGFANGTDQLDGILESAPAAATPPVGLLGGLLVAYVLLAGVVNYLFWKAMRRRVWLWVSVPALAIAFTAAAYAVGFGSRGSDYVVTGVEVDGLAPGGAEMSYGFIGVYAPRKGDIQLGLEPNTLVSTAVALDSLADAGGAVITEAPEPQLTLSNVPVWSMRSFQTLSVSDAFGDGPETMPLEARLQVKDGHLLGTVANHTSLPLSDLVVVNGSGTAAVVAAALRPGATVSVDTPFAQGDARLPDGVNVPRQVREVPVPVRNSIVQLAASQDATGRTGELALVGLTPDVGFRVEGTHADQASLAAVVEPVTLQSTDILSAVSPRARLVSTYLNPDTTQEDVYDLQIPPGLPGRPSLGYSFLNSSQPTVEAVQVYDWQAHTWRSLPQQQLAFQGQAAAPLSPAEVQGGVVRVRVQENLLGQANLTLVPPGGGG